MNITTLKTLVANLPSEITPEQFSMVELEVEEILGTQRAADEAELRAMEQRAAKLREKLGAKAPAPVAIPRVTRTEPPAGFTDADLGFDADDDNVSAAGFRAELSAIRDRNVSRRRREH